MRNKKEKAKIKSLRKSIVNGEIMIDNMKDKINKHKKIYSQCLEDGQKLFISNHAIVRYLEKIKGLKIDSSESDSVIIDRYFKTMTKKEISDFRNKVMPIEIQTHMIENDLESYASNGICYVVRKLTLITLFPQEDTK